MEKYINKAKQAKKMGGKVKKAKPLTIAMYVLAFIIGIGIVFGLKGNAASKLEEEKASKDAKHEESKLKLGEEVKLLNAKVNKKNIYLDSLKTLIVEAETAKLKQKKKNDAVEKKLIECEAYAELGIKPGGGGGGGGAVPPPPPPPPAGGGEQTFKIKLFDGSILHVSQDDIEALKTIPGFN